MWKRLSLKYKVRVSRLVAQQLKVQAKFINHFLHRDFVMRTLSCLDQSGSLQRSNVNARGDLSKEIQKQSMVYRFVWWYKI